MSRKNSSSITVTEIRQSPRSSSSKSNKKSPRQYDSPERRRRRSCGDVSDSPKPLSRQSSNNRLMRNASFRSNIDDENDEPLSSARSNSNSNTRKSSKSKKNKRRVSFSDPLIDPRPEIPYSCKRRNSKTPEPEGDNSLIDEKIDQDNKTKPILRGSSNSNLSIFKRNKVVPQRVKRKYRRRKTWWRYFACY